MASDSELKNLGEALRVTLAKLQEAGVIVSSLVYVDSDKLEKIYIDPMIVCSKCRNWSPADKCLWCKPDEFDGEGVA